MKFIGIIVAMEEELEPIKGRLEDINIKEIYEIKFYEGKIGSKEIVIAKSGVGKVNSSRCSQIMIDNYDLDYILNIGVAR